MCSVAAPAAKRSGTRCSRALAGKRIAPGPAGSPYRGRSDVLPTGRNLFAVDPRAVPTRAAHAQGIKLAEELLRRHLQDHGDWPKGLVVDLWGSATMRTAGEEFAMALQLAGVAPRWDAASGRVDRFRDHPARSARPAAHRCDVARLRPVSRCVRAAGAIVRGRLRSAVAARLRGRGKSLSRARRARVRPAARTVRRRASSPMLDAFTPGVARGGRARPGSRHRPGRSHPTAR